MFTDILHPMKACRYLVLSELMGPTPELQYRDCRCDAPSDGHCPKNLDRRRPDSRCVTGPYSTIAKVISVDDTGQ
jgi:hypothetical protein